MACLFQNFLWLGYKGRFVKFRNGSPSTNVVESALVLQHGIQSQVKFQRPHGYTHRLGMGQSFRPIYFIEYFMTDSKLTIQEVPCHRKIKKNGYRASFLTIQR